MATYFFETITDAQAAAYTAADNLVFGQTGETAFRTTVTFNSNFILENPIFPDGSVLYIGDTSATTATSGSTTDGLYGNAGNDSLASGSGTDVLQGNAGDDTLNGNAGADTIYGGRDND